MADIAITTKTNAVIRGGRAPLFIKGETSVATLKAGDIVQTSVANPDIKQAEADYADYTTAAKNVPKGVLKERSDVAIQTAIADNKTVEVVPLRSGTMVTIQSIDNLNTAILAGMSLYLSDTTPGRFELKEHVLSDPPVDDELASLATNRIATAMEDIGASANSVWIDAMLD